METDIKVFKEKQRAEMLRQFSERPTGHDILRQDIFEAIQKIEEEGNFIFAIDVSDELAKVLSKFYSSREDF